MRSCFKASWTIGATTGTIITRDPLLKFARDRVEELFEESESEESEAESEWRSGESEEGTDGDPAEGGAPA